MSPTTLDARTPSHSPFRSLLPRAHCAAPQVEYLDDEDVQLDEEDMEDWEDGEDDDDDEEVRRKKAARGEDAGAAGW